jgi:hypothetical protein
VRRADRSGSAIKWSAPFGKVCYTYRDDTTNQGELTAMVQVAATYTFVVEVDDDKLAAAEGTDRDRLVGSAVEEHIHSISDPFGDPVTIEEVD